MKVGMRELSHHTSRVLSRVKAGETLDLTEHGRTIARILPVTDDEPARPRVRLGGFRSGRATTEDDLQEELARGFGQ